MGVPKKDRFNDNWYGIRKREWYGVILRLTDFVHSISFLYASEQQGMRTAYVLYKNPAYEQLAKKIAVTRQISIQEKRQKGSSPFREGKSG